MDCEVVVSGLSGRSLLLDRNYTRDEVVSAIVGHNCSRETHLFWLDVKGEIAR